jgi:hypothetical protein
MPCNPFRFSFIILIIINENTVIYINPLKTEFLKFI